MVAGQSGSAAVYWSPTGPPSTPAIPRNGRRSGASICMSISLGSPTAASSAMPWGPVAPAPSRSPQARWKCAMAARSSATLTLAAMPARSPFGPTAWSSRVASLQIKTVISSDVIEEEASGAAEGVTITAGTLEVRDGGVVSSDTGARAQRHGDDPGGPLGGHERRRTKKGLHPDLQRTSTDQHRHGRGCQDHGRRRGGE